MKFIKLLIFVCSSTVIQAQTNYALTLNGSSQTVNIGSPINSASSYTKEAWVKLSTAAGAQNIISSLNTPFWINGGILQAGQAGNYSLVVDPNSLPLNQWIHVAVTYDAATTTMRLFRDGVLVATNIAVPGYTTEINYIGSHNGGSSYLAGQVEEVRIWNTALSEGQLNIKLFEGPAVNAAGLVAYYKCNENGGSTLVNACTNPPGIQGAIINGSSWVTSPVIAQPNSLAFDGTDDVVTITNNASLNLTNSLTIEANVYAIKPTGIQNVVSKSSAAQNNGYIFPRTDNGWSTVSAYLNIGGFKVVSAPYPSLNAWHHLAVTYDGFTIRLYIDGVLSNTLASTGSVNINTNDLAFGNQPGFSEYFGGRVDEIRIWNIVRSQAQIQANMNQELNPLFEPGLVSYYRLNQGITSGNNTQLITAYDEAGNNNGILSNFDLTGTTSNFVPQSGSILLLPLQWQNFTVQKQGTGAHLKWVTASETHTRDFIVQHSTDGIIWHDLSVIPAAGNSNTTKTYQYLHTNPGKINFYRIKQIDIDGRSSLSTIKSVQFISAPVSFLVIDKLVKNKQLQLTIMEAGKLIVTSYDGKRIVFKDVNPGRISIDVSANASGIYIIQLNGQTDRVILQ